MSAPITVTVARPAEKRPGYAPAPLILSASCDGHDYRVLVDVPAYGTVEQTNALGERMAALVTEGDDAWARASAFAESAGSNADRAMRSERRLRERLDAVLTGRALFTGRARVTVTAAGEAWLQDPVKGDAGFGLCYPDTRRLWRAWPQLRPVAWSDDGLLVEAMSMQEPP